MSNTESGLSDALRQMIDGTKPGVHDQGAAEPVAARVQASTSQAKAPEPIAQKQQPAVSTQQPQQAPDEARPARKASSAAQLKNIRTAHHYRIFMIALLVVGGLLAVIVLWALMVLAGAPVPMHARDGARSMASYMLLTSFPLAAFMFGGAYYYHWRSEVLIKGGGSANGSSRARGTARRRGNGAGSR